MLKRMLLLTLLVTITGVTIAQDSCNCKRVERTSNDQDKLIMHLEATDLNFSESFVNNRVSDVIEASYYYCDDQHGYLHIKLQGKQKLYKDVPLKTWFEFKFHDTLDSYYKSQIKYNFIAI